MSEDLKSILGKVKKLLKLAAGKANAEESASAAAKAQDLIDRYKLSVTQLEADVVEAAPVGEETLRKTGKLVLWQAQLATVLAGANSCKAYVLDMGGTKCIQLVGSAQNSEVVGYLFTYLSREINRLALAAIRKLELDGKDFYVKPKAYGHAFRLGCVKGVFEKLQEQKEQLRMEFSSTALMRLDNQLAKVDEFMKGKGLKDVKQKQQVMNDGFTAGVAAGRAIALNKGLGGSNGAAIGAGRKLLG